MPVIGVLRVAGVRDWSVPAAALAGCGFGMSSAWLGWLLGVGWLGVPTAGGVLGVAGAVVHAVGRRRARRLLEQRIADARRQVERASAFANTLHRKLDGPAVSGAFWMYGPDLDRKDG